MPHALGILANFVADFFRPRAVLKAENTLLRHQLSVARRKLPQRPRLTMFDRLLLVFVYRLYPGVLDSMRIVRPETVIRWHRMGFRARWRWKSRPLGANFTDSYGANGLNQISLIDSVTVTHDARGNTTGALGRTYGYDEDNRLVSASGTGIAASTLAYDPAYANSINSSQIDWDGVAWDLANIAFLAGTGGVYSPGLTISEALVAVRGAGLAAGSELAHTDLCD